ncbi:GAF domain-containing protein [Rhodocytophaga rosea]|uniref:GAF domain-containing protein n=1 Tax=Rhodocytophaga rosea TaxID=2704465 RepID=A0A6C0GDU6_9BACT|nr:GAF domain-containing protein [Rhodocytophaga rosea]QHT66135.1 GAF domain-containing protein [Rhodocytophaga rosea]
MNIIHRIKDNIVVFSAFLIILLVTGNAGLIFYNQRIAERMAAIKSQTDQAKKLNSLIWDDIIRNFDIGLRGFALTKDEALLSPYKEAIVKYPGYFKSLDSLLTVQNYPHKNEVASIGTAYDEYVKVSDQMVELARQDSMSLFTLELKKDRGKDIWMLYDKSTRKLAAFEDQLYMIAVTDYQDSNIRTAYLQVLLILIVLPTLLFMIVRIRRDARERRQLFKELEENNHAYLFNPGHLSQVFTEREVINNSIINFKKAAGFINHMSKGNYQVEWEGLTEANGSLNQTNLAGELVQMREKMIHLKQEDEKRLWSTEGVARFSEIVRSHQHHLQELCEQIVIFAVKYLKAQQAGLFLLREDDEQAYLELMACYAFNRKKYVTKRVLPGEGLVGQAYREGDTILLTEVPQDYTAITSGLGDATPTCILLVPMQYNGQVQAVIELASFEKFEPYQVEWLEKVGEITASTLVSVKNSERNHHLLEQFKQQTEQMRAQEEELRQNMEEIEATQEEMHRKEKELEKRQSELSQG